MTVPNQFANVPGGSKIPLNELDENFTYIEDQLNSDVQNLQGQINSVVSAVAVTNVAALRLTPVTSGKTAELLGYYAANDGGGGFFYGTTVGYLNTTFNNSPSTTSPYITSNVNGFIFVINNHGLSNFNVVRFTTTGSLPPGLSSSEIYTVVGVSQNQFQIQLNGAFVAPTTTPFTYSGVTVIANDDGGMNFSAIGGRWVRELPDNGEISVLWFGAVNTDPTISGNDASPFFKNAINWINRQTLPPRTICAPNGRYRIGSAVDFGRINLRGDGGQNISVSGINTEFHFYGTGWCFTFSQNTFASNFWIYGKNTSVWQNGLLQIAGVHGSLSNIMIYDMNCIGLQFYKSSVGGPLFYDVTNIGIVNQDVVSGNIGFLNGGSGLYNANSNVFTGVFVKGKWKVLYEICGNGSIFSAGDCEPVNGSPDYIENWYLIRGNANQIVNPYIEPSNSSTISSTFADRYKPIKFSGLWKVVEFLKIPTAGDTLLLNGTTITFVASGASGNQCNIGATIQDTVLNLETMINASVDANLTVLNAYARYEEIVFDQRYLTPPSSLTVTCTSANSAFRLPTGVSATTWATTSGNSFKGTNWATNYFTNTASSILDYGASNNFDGTRIFTFNVGLTGDKVSTRNLAPNSDFRSQYVGAGSSLVPSGYYVRWLNSTTITRVTTPTPNGASFALKVDVSSGGRFELRFLPTSANLYGNAPTINIEKLKNKTIKAGFWCKSDIKGLGAGVLLPGSSAAVGQCEHSGSGEWEFLVTSGRILNTVNTDLVAFIMANNITLTSDSIGGGTFYISQPVFMFGNVVPDVAQPLLLDDSDSQCMGRLAFNTPQQLLDGAGANNSTTPDVSQFNLYNEAYTTPTNVSQFLGGRAGQEISVFTSTANITFVHTAAATANTIYTKDGSNIISVANKLYTFKSNGTKWFQV